MLEDRDMALEAVRELSRQMAIPGADPRRALVAALNAWPGAFVNKGNGGLPVRLHLPLPQEPKA